MQTRFHASDVDLVARSVERASPVTSVESLRLAFPSRIALRVSYQNRVTNPAPDAAESFERIKVARPFSPLFSSSPPPPPSRLSRPSIIFRRFSSFMRNLSIDSDHIGPQHSCRMESYDVFSRIECVFQNLSSTWCVSLFFMQMITNVQVRQ